MPEAVHPCPHCGKAVAQTDRFCPHCHKGLAGAAALSESARQTSSPGMVLCLIVSSIAVLGGIATTPSEPFAQGLAALAVACFFAICARIAQAGHQHKQLLRELSKTARIGLALIAALGLSTAANAQDRGRSDDLKTPTLVFAAAAAGDWISTYDFLKDGRGREGNPALSWLDHRPAAMVALGASIDAASVWAWNKYVGRKKPKLAKIGLYVAAGVRAWLAFHNSRLERHEPPRWGGIDAPPSVPGGRPIY